ncbi:glycine cleavage system protein GcvH [Acaricomes phytoseiuli]|uniref:glycine cleavage system protein GcvH n=1 Tax=Acaricomes phytoseiuli TaxID=291968 RepID=UPI0003720EB6|nr:glycine cleavage system protein GcvH [Acaricomes phytoseiuli]MCW1250243.1 glycine cleavage system protein GcvH [Acaricomes phytoseiuli]
MSKVVPELRYSAEHEWVAVDSAAGSESVMTVGVSAIATEALGDIVYLDLPEAGSSITAGQSCGEVESTKSVSDLYAPVTGEITEVNPAAIADPALVNRDPYGAGWLFKVTVTEEGPLLSASEYATANGVEL